MVLCMHSGIGSLLKHVKTYFTLREVQARWSASTEDLQYFILNDLLEVSVWTMGMAVITPDGRDTSVLDGVQPVFGKDLWPVLRTGAGQVHRFRRCDTEVVRQDQASPFLVRDHDLLVTRIERDRFERVNGFVIEAEPTAAPQPFDPLATFKHDATYVHISIANARFRLGAIQGNIVKQLHEAAMAGHPWIHQDELLGNTNAKPPRIVDLFDDKQKLAALIQRDGSGNCRLNLPLKPVTSLQRSAYSAGMFRAATSKGGRASHPSPSASPSIGR